jgi:hypothetical protein
MLIELAKNRSLFSDRELESVDELFQVLRYEPKAFRRRRPDGKGGWTGQLRCAEEDTE